MNDDYKSISDLVTQGIISVPNSFSYPCNCRGPQPGQPKCPCMMRGVIQRDGRWIQTEVDLGPVK